MPQAPARRRGRPAGGGISAEESRQAFLDAAERSFSTRGYRASTMEVIAREAGYSRANIYRAFPTRERLLEALVQRTAQRFMAQLVDRLPDGMEPVSVLTESMVIVATELVHDPLLKTVSEQYDDRTVAQMLANDEALTRTVEAVMEQMVKDDAGNKLRQNLHPKDLAQFFISTAIGMLASNIPGIENPDTARRYIDVFVLPVFVAEPPPPRRVFTDGD